MFKRKCPNCNKMLLYANTYDMLYAERDETTCKSCAHIGIKFSEIHKKHLRENHADISGKNHPMYGKRGKNHPLYGKHHSKKTIQKMQDSAKKRPFVSKEIKQKLREATLKRVGGANFNKNACKIIDDYGKEYGYDFQHALNGGEFRVIGYSVDGYDKEKNAVIEFYENQHRRQWRKDLVRQRRIMKELDCKFIVLKEWEI